MTEAVSILNSGGVIVYPTDTAYAIGCDATNEDAVKKIFEIKCRKESKTLPLIAASIEMVKEWAEMTEKAEELAQKYWPGPLTLVLPVKKQSKGGHDPFLTSLHVHEKWVMSPLVQNDGFIAIRVPDSKIARELSKKLGAPMVSTSANRAGRANCYTVKAVKRSLGKAFNRIDCVVDQGQLPEREVSTIAKVWDNKIIVLREGAIRL